MNKKTVFVIITGILLAVAGAGVGATFSRYTSEATATPAAKVAKWAVKVNNQDISNGGENNFDAKIEWDQNENVQNGFFAPGSIGHIIFTIDATGTQVPVEYSIAINTNDIKTHQQIQIKNVSYSLDNEQSNESKTLNKDNSNELEQKEIYSGSIGLNDSKKIKIDITVEWSDQTEKNSDDTTLGAGTEDGDNTVLSLPITVTASQKVA